MKFQTDGANYAPVGIEPTNTCELDFDIMKYANDIAFLWNSLHYLSVAPSESVNSLRLQTMGTFYAPLSLEVSAGLEPATTSPYSRCSSQLS